MQILTTVGNHSFQNNKMQNDIIKYIMYDNTVNNGVLINPTKQQFFMIPREESQVFSHTTYDYTGYIPSGYSNDPDTSTENRDGAISTTTDPHLQGSFMPTDWVGMSMYTIPHKIDPDFAHFVLNRPNASSPEDYYRSDILSYIHNGFQILNIKENTFSQTLTDPTDIANNGGNPIKPVYGKYYLLIRPKYIQTTVVSVEHKAHFEFSKLGDNTTVSGSFIVPNKKRRNIYYLNRTPFENREWNFEADREGWGRLMGSVVEIYNSNGSVLKQTKVIAENSIFGNPTYAQVCMNPDHMGYDSSTIDVIPGDVVVIYPRETYFNQIIVEISFEDKNLDIKSALEHMMNDAVRDMKTGIYEIYDENGVTIDSNGNANGTVSQRYQVQQFGQYEVRKKIKR